MHRQIRTTLGLVIFIAIQAIGVAAISRNWAAAGLPSNARLLLTLSAYMGIVMIAGAAAAVVWGGSAPPKARPGKPPPALSPAGLPVGPRRHAPLVAHAVPAEASDT